MTKILTVKKNSSQKILKFYNRKQTKREYEVNDLVL